MIPQLKQKPCNLLIGIRQWGHLQGADLVEHQKIGLQANALAWPAAGLV
jgi:hypothetical protein